MPISRVGGRRRISRRESRAARVGGPHSAGDGTVEPLADWLRTNVHQHGQRYTTTELVTRATGEELTVDHFLAYARDKFEPLYDL